MSNQRRRPKLRRAENKLLQRLRRSKSPAALGALDWLTYRANQNPFEPDTAPWHLYEVSFRKARRKYGKTTLGIMPTPKPRTKRHD